MHPVNAPYSSPRLIRTRKALVRRIQQVADEFSEILFPRILYVGNDETMQDSLASEIPGLSSMWPIPRRWTPSVDNTDVIIIDDHLDFDALQSLSDLCTDVPTIICCHRPTDPIDKDTRTAPIIFLPNPSPEVVITNALNMFRLGFGSVYYNAIVPLISSNDVYLTTLSDISAALACGESMVISADSIEHLKSIHKWLDATIELPDLRIIGDAASGFPVDFTQANTKSLSSNTTVFIYQSTKQLSPALQTFLKNNSDTQFVVFRSKEKFNTDKEGREGPLLLDDCKCFELPDFSTRSQDAETIAYYYAILQAGTSAPHFLPSAQIKNLARSNDVATTAQFCHAIKTALDDGFECVYTPDPPRLDDLMWTNMSYDSVFTLIESTVFDLLMNRSAARIVSKVSRVKKGTIYRRKQRTYKNTDLAKS